VRIVLEGVDKFSNLIGSVYYPDGDSAKDLALELVENVSSSPVQSSLSLFNFIVGLLIFPAIIFCFCMITLAYVS